jgi:MFS family permease
LGLFLIASIAGGFAWSLLTGGISNYILDNVPANDRPAYLAWYNLIFNAGILLGALVGPFLAGYLGLSTALILFGCGRLLIGVAILRWG